MVVRVDIVDIADDSRATLTFVVKLNVKGKELKASRPCLLVGISWSLIFRAFFLAGVALRASLHRFFERNQIDSTLRNEASLSFPMEKRRERGLQRMTVHHRISFLSASVLKNQR